MIKEAMYILILLAFFCIASSMELHDLQTEQFIICQNAKEGHPYQPNYCSNQSNLEASSSAVAL